MRLHILTHMHYVECKDMLTTAAWDAAWSRRRPRNTTTRKHAATHRRLIV